MGMNAAQYEEDSRNSDAGEPEKNEDGSRQSDTPASKSQKKPSLWGDTMKDFAPIKEDQDESDSEAEIREWERKLKSLIDKVTKKKYKEFEEKRVQHFDIFKMKMKNYS